MHYLNLPDRWEHRMITFAWEHFDACWLFVNASQCVIHIMYTYSASYPFWLNITAAVAKLDSISQLPLLVQGWGLDLGIFLVSNCGYPMLIVTSLSPLGDPHPNAPSIQAVDLSPRRILRGRPCWCGRPEWTMWMRPLGGCQGVPFEDFAGPWNPESELTSGQTNS